jgi:hypothetical protein
VGYRFRTRRLEADGRYCTLLRRQQVAQSQYESVRFDCGMKRHPWISRHSPLGQIMSLGFCDALHFEVTAFGKAAPCELECLLAAHLPARTDRKVIQSSPSLAEVVPVSTCKPFRIALCHMGQAEAEGMGLIDTGLLNFLIGDQHGL